MRLFLVISLSSMFLNAGVYLLMYGLIHQLFFEWIIGIMGFSLGLRIFIILTKELRQQK